MIISYAKQDPCERSTIGLYRVDTLYIEKELIQFSQRSRTVFEVAYNFHAIDNDEIKIHKILIQANRVILQNTQIYSASLEENIRIRVYLDNGDMHQLGYRDFVYASIDKSFIINSINRAMNNFMRYYKDFRTLTILAQQICGELSSIFISKS